MSTESVPNEEIREKVIESLKTVYDPEIPVDIYELGLIYDITVDESAAVKITMTLTSPMCPVAETLPVEVKDKIEALPGVQGTEVDVIWDPPWDPSKMTEAARLELGM